MTNGYKTDLLRKTTARAKGAICIVNICGATLLRRTCVKTIQATSEAPLRPDTRVQRLFQLHKDGPVFGPIPEMLPTNPPHAQAPSPDAVADAWLRQQLEAAREEIALLRRRVALLEQRPTPEDLTAAQEAVAAERARCAALADSLAAALKRVEEPGEPPARGTTGPPANAGDGEMMALFLRFVERE